MSHTLFWYDYTDEQDLNSNLNLTLATFRARLNGKRMRALARTHAHGYKKDDTNSAKILQFLK